MTAHHPNSSGDPVREATRTTAREVLSAAWPVMLSYVAVGLPCGVLAAKAGMAPLMNFVLSLTFLSGPQ